MFEEGKPHWGGIQEVVVLGVEFPVILVQVNNEGGLVVHIFVQDVFPSGSYALVSRGTSRTGSNLVGDLRCSTTTGTTGGSIALLGTGCWVVALVGGRAFPLGFAVISGRILLWLVARATVTVPPLAATLAAAAFAECFALCGGFFADMDGEGEEEDPMPFVCMPGGMGRFVFGCGGMTGGGIGVVLGAISTANGFVDIVIVSSDRSSKFERGTERRVTGAGGQTLGAWPVACDL